MDFLESIRWGNIAMIVLAQCLIQHFILDSPFTSNFILLIIITIASLSGGYMENNILDYELDTECKHKPKNTFLSSSQAMTTVFVFYFLAVVLSWILSNNIGNFTFLYAVLVSISLLHFYNTVFKKVLLLGNLSVAFLSTLSALLPYFMIYDLTFQPVFLFISIFCLSWSREWVKDLQDQLCDQLYGYKTMAVVFPIQYNQVMLITILSLYIIYIVFIPFQYNYFLLIFPIVSIIQLLRKKWDLASSALKAALFVGIISIIYL